MTPLESPVVPEEYGRTATSAVGSMKAGSTGMTPRGRGLCKS